MTDTAADPSSDASPAGAPLPGGPLPGDPLAVRRRRLRFRAWHRGTREADLLIGSFADAHIEGFDSGRLDRFEALLELSDPDLYNWMTGREPVPAEHDTDVMRLLQGFRFTPRPGS